jgi:hypothetical protein
MPDQPSHDIDGPEYAGLDRRRALHAFDWGALATIGVALAYGLFWGAGILHFGLIAIAVMSGWIIGAAVRHGAWRAAWKETWHVPSRRLKALGVTFAVVAWFGGALVAYVVSRALLPESDLSFTERLAALTFGEYMTQQYEAGGLIHALSLAVMAIMGWRTAR